MIDADINAKNPLFAYYSSVSDCILFYSWGMVTLVSLPPSGAFEQVTIFLIMPQIDRQQLTQHNKSGFGSID
jgi:hypothetical protein